MTLFFCLFSSVCFAANSSPRVGTVTPASGTSNPYQQVSFTTTYTDANGWQDIQYVYLLINSSTSGSKCFYGYYNRTTNLLYLRNDASSGWLGGFAPASPNIIENSYAKLDCSQTTVNGSGNTLSITWKGSFKTTFTGTKKTYLYVKDNAGAHQGWIQKGTWKINPNTAPLVGTITPASGSGIVNTPVTFITTYIDPNTWQDIQYAYFLVNTSTTGSKCFYGYYDRTTNKLYLRNDAGTIWLGGFAPSSSQIIENSYCKLDCSQTTVSGSSTTLTINWVVTFKSTFLGAENTYLYVKDYAGAYQGWIKKGTITIQSQPADTTPPTGSIKINNDTQYTNSTSVTLNLSAQDNPGGSGLSQMQFSNDNITWSAPESYSTSKSWTLSSGEGTKTVYAKYKDVAGNWSQTYSDTIILDTTPPSLPQVFDDGQSTHDQSQLHCRWSSSDAGSGISEYQYCIRQDSVLGPIIVNWASAGSNTEVTHSPLNLVIGKKYFFLVKAKDNAGQWSSEGYSDGIEVTGGPAAPLVIDDGQYTGLNTKLHASWSALDPDFPIVEYQYSLGTSPGSANVINWTNTSLTEVTVTGLNLSYGFQYYFNVKAKNTQGVWGAVGSSDGVSYDYPPQVNSVTTNNASPMEGDAVIISASATDPRGDALQLQFSIDGIIKKPWSNAAGGAASYTWQTSIGDGGLHKIKIEARDNKVDPVSKEISIFIYRKPYGPPQ